ncbi:hypothetical protein G3545_14065 [Starkeya sp. ORNL1]|uniref:hypothetical protein n=1 Tax=Starkeya sp. ORNL1 TaxID=2709380 RepID=UPI0014648CE0|nr:hypothetical protein [Starkeya sp. ORNL1]QJP14669.1 hypothetical protein G3545_14065 [Starkeya sp. ORNL1]
MSWTDELIGIPYRERGRAETLSQAHSLGVDCLGCTMLARLVRTGERMPEAGIDITANLRAAVLRARDLMGDPVWQFRKVGEHVPEEMDIVVMLRTIEHGDRRQPLHVGTWLADGRILHTQAPAHDGQDMGSCLIDSRHPKVAARIAGFARWSPTVGSPT